jgi:hypothetical protein
MNSIHLERPNITKSGVAVIPGTATEDCYKVQSTKHFPGTESVSGLTTAVKFAWEVFNTVFAILKLPVVLPVFVKLLSLCRVLAHTAAEY